MQINSNPAKIDFAKLESFVYNHPNANFFQSTKAFNFFNEISNYEPFFIIAEVNNEIVGSLLAIIIKEGNGIKGYMSKRCIVWGGPLVKVDDEKIYYSLLNKLDDLVNNKVIYTEFRNLYDLHDKIALYKNNGYQFFDHLNYIIKNNDIVTTLNNIKGEKRRQIRKSLREGSSIKLLEEKSELEDLYQILKKIYSEKVKKPIPALEFFESLISSHSSVALGLFYEKHLIGGAILPFYKDTIYDWYRGGLDNEFKKQYPSTLAVWAGLEYGNKNGFTKFDFMGAGKPNEDYGVRDFKSQFGGELVNYGRFRKINSPMKYKVGELGVKVLGKISK